MSLVDNLEYKIPKLIRDTLIKKNSDGALGSVLDLGCGSDTRIELEITVIGRRH